MTILEQSHAGQGGVGGGGESNVPTVKQGLCEQRWQAPQTEWPAAQSSTGIGKRQQGLISWQNSTEWCDDYKPSRLHSNFGGKGPEKGFTKHKIMLEFLHSCTQETSAIPELEPFQHNNQP